MMLNVYALKDKKAGCFISQIMFYDNDKVQNPQDMRQEDCVGSCHK